jgi:hypothetical protein
MATCKLPAREAGHASAAALHQLKTLLQHDPSLAQALRASPTT